MGLTQLAKYQICISSISIFPLTTLLTHTNQFMKNFFFILWEIHNI